MDKVFDFVLVALAISAVSLTVTRSHLFERWRDYLQDHRPNDLFTQTVTCPYCFAHWAALVPAFWWTAIFFYAPTRIAAWALFITSWLAFVAASALIMGAMIKLLLHSEWEMEKLKRRLRDKEKSDER